MAEMLEVIETLRQEEADVSKLFEKDLGTPVAHKAKRIQPADLLGAARFIEQVEKGKRPMYHLKEAMTTSDFPLMFADIIDRQMLGQYNSLPQTYQTIMRTSTVTDFRNVKRFAVDGAEGALPEVKERAEYPETPLTESKDEFAVKKVGRRIDLSWEAMVNDDLDAFRRNPERLAIAAKRSEEKFATELYVGANGPHASLYTSGHKNIVTGNPELSIEALQKAFVLLSEQSDNDGEPIWTEMMTLVVGPALKVTAENILHATELWLNTAGGNEKEKLRVNNWMQNQLQLVIAPYLPRIASSANGNTSWFLFSDPNTARPAIDFGKLRGHEEPAIYERMPNARRLGGGGGEVNEAFEDDSVAWRIRHVFGGTQLNSTGGYKATVASNGSKS